MLRLRHTLLAIYKTIREECGLAALDENLWAFWGFYHAPDDRHYQVRQWRKIRLSTIEPRQVIDLPVWEMAFMLNVAMELEDPILDYSRQNGEGFRVVLPSLARFMGKNHDEAAYAAAHDLPWCESPWCAEERRHANAFARIIERLVQASPPRDNPNRPMIATPQEADAVRLIISREAAEWNSSSTYLVLAVHATGELHELIGNVARDEIKHLAILSAADRYLFGPRTWRRFRDLVRNSLDEYGGHKRKRSGGELLGTSWVTALEVVVGHLLVEIRVRTWLRSLPVITLSSVFETSPSALSVAQQKGYERRARLDRWKLRVKRRTEELQAWEREHVNSIEDVIATKLRGFAEAEEPDSPGDRMVRRQIRWLRPKMLRQSLLDRLRDYQVRNNCYVRAHQPPASQSRYLEAVPERPTTRPARNA